MHGIGVKRDAPADLAGALAHRLGDLRHRLDDADLVVRRHHADQDRALVHRPRGVGRVDQAIAVDRQVGNLEAELLQVLAAMEDGVVLDCGGDDVVAHPRQLLGEGDALDRGVDRLCPAASEAHLGAAAAEQAGDAVAGRVYGFGGLPGEAIGGRWVAETLLQVGQHRLAHLGMEGRRGGVIEVDEVLHMPAVYSVQRIG